MSGGWSSGTRRPQRQITEKPLKSRWFLPGNGMGPGKDKRGEAPKGVPRAGRSKTLKGEPHGCWAVDGSSAGANRCDSGPMAYAVGVGVAKAIAVGAGLRTRVVFLNPVFEITDREQTVERVLKP